MNNKKIAIVFLRWNIGGAEKSLIELLKNIDRSVYRITVYVCNWNAIDPSQKEQFPDDVQVISLNDSENQDISNISPFEKMMYRIRLHLSKKENKRFLYSILTYPKYQETYDCAIAYKLDLEDTVYMLQRISAKKYCAWIHGEISEIPPDVEKIGKLFCVSEDTRAAVIRQKQSIKSATELFYNLFDRDDILKLSATPPDFGMTAEIKLLTVGRLHPVKGQTMVPRATRLLLDAGYDVTWYLVGDGPSRGEVETEIEKYGVQDRVILLGTKENPYPYIKNCTIYVQPSFSEGYCTTTVEAKILRKPVVTTDAPGMREQFVSGENGIIVDAMTSEALFDGIKTLLDHPELRQKIIDNLALETFDNRKELQKLYDFIES